MGVVAMSCAVTAREIDELEQMVVSFHSKHRDEFGSYENCTHAICADAKGGVAWLRAQLMQDQIKAMRRQHEQDISKPFLAS
jgi:hypothetical protein